MLSRDQNFLTGDWGSVYMNAVSFVNASFSKRVDLLFTSQAAQTRRVKKYKDLYGNLDNKLKKIFSRKSSQ